jgi:hypothetical protein
VRGYVLYKALVIFSLQERTFLVFIFNHSHSNIPTQPFHYCYYAACICYDDACHLKKYACNPSRRDCTEASTKISSLDIVVDKLHFRGHVDAWCHQNCDPYKIEKLKQVRTYNDVLHVATFQLTLSTFTKRHVYVASYIYFNNMLETLCGQHTRLTGIDIF